MQKPPVRFDARRSYSNLQEFMRLCIDRRTGEFAEVTAMEVFSVLYSLVRPCEAVERDDVLALIGNRFCPARRAKGKSRALRLRPRERT